AGPLWAMLLGGKAQPLRRFDGRGRAARRNTVQMQMFLGIFMGALSLTGSLALVAIYFFGGSAVIAGSLSVGTLIALATLAQRVYGPVLDLASIRLNLVSGLVALERIFEVLDKEPMIKELLDPVRRDRLEGRGGVGRVGVRHPPP